MRVLPTNKNARGKKITQAKRPKRNNHSQRNTRNSSAQKDSDTNINIIEKSSLEHSREPTINETNIITATANKDTDKKTVNNITDDSSRLEISSSE